MEEYIPIEPSDLQVFRGCQLSSTSSDYIVEDLVGNGAFARVAKCVKSATNETVALRITKLVSESYAKEEEETLQKLKAFDPDIWNFVRWESSFTYKGHLCQEFELLDMSLRDFVSMRPTCSLHLKEIRPILRQVARALEALRSLEIAHTDLKLENIMLVDHARQPFRVKVIDFGSACNVSRQPKGSYLQTRWYRAPETILGLACNETIDMWSLGCIAAELLLGFALYPGTCEYQMLWFITQTQGQLPQCFLDAGLKTSLFYQKTWSDVWKIMTPEEYGLTLWCNRTFSSLDDLKEVQRMPQTHLSEAEAMADKADLENFVELVKQMLQLDPIQRITPSQVTHHPFLETRKRAFVETFQGCTRRPERPFPPRKKKKNCGGRSRVKRTRSEMSEGSLFFADRKKRRMTPDTELPSTSKDGPSTVRPQKRKEKASRSESDTRDSGCTPRETKRKKEESETNSVTKIWIVGDSYIKRGEEAAYQKFGENLGLHAKVKWFGKPGRLWCGVLPTFYTKTSTQSPPDILVVHAGGNDLGRLPAKALASRVKRDLMKLHAEFPSMTIAFSCINKRQAWRYGEPWRMNKDRKTVNKHIRRNVGHFGGEFIEHPLPRRRGKNVFVADGVHFTEDGNDLFVTSISCALSKILQRDSM